jgi:hypothetical protein
MGGISEIAFGFGFGHIVSGRGVKDVESKKEREKKARNEEKKKKEKRKKQGGEEEEEERGVEFGR